MDLFYDVRADSAHSYVRNQHCPAIAGNQEPWKDAFHLQRSPIQRWEQEVERTNHD